MSSLAIAPAPTLSGGGTRVVDLLRALAEDDAFRARAEADPVAAFAEFGVEVDAGDVPAYVTLPSREDAAALLRAGRSDDTPELIFVYIW